MAMCLFLYHSFKHICIDKRPPLFSMQTMQDPENIRKKRFFILPIIYRDYNMKWFSWTTPNVTNEM
jgi:hypothetical protein